MTDPQVIQLAATASRLRRELGPTAWVVLEELWTQAADTNGTRTACASARSLAVDLGLNPATVAKSLRRLRELGLVALDRSPGEGGRFGLSAYRLDPAAGIIQPHADEPHAAAPRGAVPRTARPNAVAPRGADRSQASARRRPVNEGVEQPARPATGAVVVLDLFADGPS